MEKARHAAEYERASAAWDALKSNPSAKGYEKARQDFELAKLPAKHAQARAELDRAIKAADAAFPSGSMPYSDFRTVSSRI